MAQQDVRYYLNGLLFSLADRRLRCVATDGHRLALCETALEAAVQTTPDHRAAQGRAGTAAPAGEAATANWCWRWSRNHLRVKRDDVTFTSKLIDGRFPDYEAVIRRRGPRVRWIRRPCARRSSARRSSGMRGVRIEVSPNQLKINAHNPEQEEAQEDRSRHGRCAGGGLQRQLSARATNTSCCGCARQLVGPGARGGQRKCRRGDAVAAVTDRPAAEPSDARIRAFCCRADASMRVTRLDVATSGVRGVAAGTAGSTCSSATTGWQDQRAQPAPDGVRPQLRGRVRGRLIRSSADALESSSNGRKPANRTLAQAGLRRAGGHGRAAGRRGRRPAQPALCRIDRSRFGGHTR